MFYFLRSYFIVLIETVCNIIFFEIFVQTDRRNRRFFLSKGLVILFLSFLSCANAFFWDRNFLIKQIVDIVLTAVILSLYWREKAGKCLVLSVVYTGILWLADFITVLVYPSMMQQAETVSETETEEFLVIVLAKLVLFLIIMLMSNTFRYNNMRYIKEKDWIAFLAIPIASMAVTFAFIKNVRLVIGTELEQLFAGLALGLVCMNIIMFYWIQNMGKQEYLLREKALLESKTRNQLQLYQAISEKVQHQRKISHEYENQLTCIQSLCEAEEYDKLKEYLEQLRGGVLHNVDYINTNHVIVNAVLNAKYQEAIEKNILVVWKVNDLSRLTISSSDLVVLLSNLLNNAVEACEKCGKERSIKVKCFYEEDEFVLSVRNTYNGRLNIFRGELYTTKSEERESHGIGLKNVIQVIEKNQGYYTMEHTDTEFWISIIIPQGT